MFQNAYQDKKVLILGHTGFKGSWLTHWLQKLGAQVIGISNTILTEPSHFRASGLDQDPNLITHYLDIRSNELPELFKDISPDFIFHLAAQALVRESYNNPLETFSSNTFGTANVLESLRQLEPLRSPENPCTAIIITSDKAYENTETFYGYRETDRLGGADPYSASKAAAEIIISSYQRSYFKQPDTIKIATGRAGNVIGGGDWSPDRLIPDIIKAWHNQEQLQIRNPDATRPWQHVLEPLSGYLTLGAELQQNPDLHGEAFNFGPPADSVYSVHEVLNTIQKHINIDVLINEPEDTLHEAGLLKLCCDKALTKLAWQATLEFDKTIEYTAQWYSSFYNNQHNQTDTEAPLIDKIKQLTLKQINNYETEAINQHLPWTITK